MANGSFAELKEALRARADEGGRYVLPSDGNTAFSTLHVRAIREEMREVDFICSTEKLDTWGTILEQDWDLKRYKANPVVLYAHKSRELPIGQAKNIRVEGSGAARQLVATVWFSDAHQMARDVWTLVLERTLRGISVGFDFSSCRFEMVDDVEHLVLSGLELIELSITPTPSNGDCLAQIRARASAPLNRASGDASPKTTPKAAPRSTEKKTMNEEEIKALQLRTAELSTKNLEIEARAKAAESALEKTAKERDELSARFAAIETQNKALVGERDAAIERAVGAEKQVIGLEVDALVGKKITPAERDTFARLREVDKKLFDDMVAQRQVMPHGQQMIPDVGNQTPPPPVVETDKRAKSEADLAAFNAELAKG